MNIKVEPNVLYYGDCLDIMALFPDNYFDLIYLDSPFNSNEKHNAIFKGKHGLKNIDPQIKANVGFASSTQPTSILTLGF